MDSGEGLFVSPGIERRVNNKRHTIMDDSPWDRSESPEVPLAAGSSWRDEHYHNEHPQRRRRSNENLASRPRIARYVGDGLDFRRPIQSLADDFARRRQEAEQGGSNRGQSEEHVWSQTQATVIDLTDDDPIENSQMAQAPAPEPATRAQRLPRFGRNVLASEDGDDAEEDTNTQDLPGAQYLALPAVTAAGAMTRPQFSALRRPTRPPSPPFDIEDDLEFVTARPVSRNRARRPPSPRVRMAPRSVTPFPAGHSGQQPIDLTADDDDVVVVTSRQNQNAGTNLIGPLGATNGDYQTMGRIANIIREGGAAGGRLLQRLHTFAGAAAGAQAQERMNDINELAAGIDRHRRQHHHHVQNHHHHHRQQQRNAGFGGFGGLRPGGFGPGPVMMDYDMTGFDLGLPGGNRPPTPKYSPPPEPEEGFTRSPEEDEVVVCPNCGDELAVGDGEAKQEVWVVKQCGHAYCGECAQQRGKGPEKPSPKSRKVGRTIALSAAATSISPPFKKCVVEGCAKPAGRQSMLRVFLGT